MEARDAADLSQKATGESQVASTEAVTLKTDREWNSSRPRQREIYSRCCFRQTARQALRRLDNRGHLACHLGDLRHQMFVRRFKICSCATEGIFPLVQKTAEATESGRLTFQRLRDWKASEIGFCELFHALQALG